jgi:glycosyltransferase involved in cell wall biosynthesis
MPPEISVLLPARNAASTVLPALRSLARQTFRNFECLVVDDGSSDATPALVRDFARSDPRFTLLSLAESGLVAALNAGLSRARGRFVARMDADDLAHKQRLALQLRTLGETPALDGVGCHVRTFPRTALTPGRLAYEAWLNGLESAADVERDAFIECPLAHPTWLLRRELAIRLGYADRGWPEDYDLLLRALGSGSRLGVTPKKLLLWRDSEKRHSRSSAVYSLSAFTRCKAHYLARQKLAASSSYVLWGYGDTGRSLARELAALGRHPTAIIELHPGRIGQRILGVPVVAPQALPQLAERPVLVSVAGAAARAEIREFMHRAGLLEGTDFVVTA